MFSQERKTALMGGYYDRDGNPINLTRWIELHNDSGYVRVAISRGNGWHMSTVWLGADHGIGDGPPLIFETMVFAEGSWDALHCERYPTVQAALEGHRRIAAAFRNDWGG